MLIDPYVKLLNAYKEKKIDKNYLRNSIDVIINFYEYRKLIHKIEEIEEETRKEME